MLFLLGNLEAKEVTDGYRFIYVRHGSTDWSIDKINQRVIDLPLSENGVSEICDTASKLKTVVFNPIICFGPLLRAK